MGVLNSELMRVTNRRSAVAMQEAECRDFALTRIQTG